MEKKKNRRRNIEDDKDIYIHIQKKREREMICEGERIQMKYIYLALIVLGFRKLKTLL